MKKRLLSLVLSVLLLLGVMPTTLPAQATEPAPAQIGTETIWHYYDGTTDPAGDTSAAEYNRTSWTTASFDDSAWKTAAGSFGSKYDESANGADNQLTGCPGDGTNHPVYFFRTHVTVADAAAVTRITGEISYDDAAVIYINGVRAGGFNDAGCDSNTSYCSAKANNTDAFSFSDAALLAALKTGDNVVSVELHNESGDSSDIYFGLTEMIFSTEAAPLVTQDTEWTYLDNGTDPAGDATSAGYDRTSWSAVDYAPSADWKTGVGPFGSKRGGATLEDGYTANTVLAGCDGANDTPAYFYRTTFTVPSLNGMHQLIGTLQYDDAAIVYINGVRVAAFDDNACAADGTELEHGFDSNTQYGGSNDGTPKTDSFNLADMSVLHTGVNTLALEHHNGRATSSDCWFQMMELYLSKEKIPAESNISLSMGADESKMNFTWYSVFADAGSIAYAPAAELTDGQLPESAKIVTAASKAASDSGKYSNQLTITDLAPATEYAYQLTNGGIQSDVYTFTTGGAGDFSFAYVGDPQIGAGDSLKSDAAGWEKTLNIIDTNSIFTDSSFLLSAGDQVNVSNDEEQYDDYLDHDALYSLPTATAVGNHDSDSAAYDEHFNAANESTQYGVTNAGGDSYFVYNNTLFMVLNSNNMSVAEHTAFMKDAIETTKMKNIRWKIVMFHHSIYTVANHSSDSYITNPYGFKNSIAPVFQMLDIDVVLQGHDHVYCRTYMMDGLEPITESGKYAYANGTNAAPTSVTDPTGILYVTANSGSGSKTYNIKSDVNFGFSAVSNQEHVANVSKVSISDNSFTITTYRTTDMTVVDSFTINRTPAVVGIEITKQPKKTAYTDGEQFDTTGMIVTATYADGTSAPIEQYAVNPTKLTVGTTEVTIIHQGKTATVPVTVSPKIQIGKPEITVNGIGGTFSAADDGKVILVPDAGYEVADVTVNGESVGAILTLDDMKTSDVVVVRFRKVLPFTDIPEHAWYLDAVKYTYDNNLFKGISGNQFGAEVTTTRGMIVTLLYRLEHEPEIEGTLAFDDVTETQYDAKAILWGTKVGIVKGYDNHCFGSNDAVTREQLATFMYRYAQYKQYETAANGDISSFADADSVSKYAADAVKWAVGAELIRGTDKNKLDCAGRATRSQTATILMRFCQGLASN